MTKNEIAMDNAIDYNDLHDIKRCIRQIDKLQHTAEAGNMTAACIYTDIIGTFKRLSIRQRQCINLVMLQGYNIEDAAVVLNISHQCVADHVKTACQRISYILEDVNHD